MSRIGKQPVAIPKGVELKFSNGIVTVKGPKGQLEQKVHDSMDLKIEDEQVTVVPKADTKLNRRFYGLTRALLNNMVVGTSTGFTKSLSLVGVGYRAAMKGKDLNLTLGYSHPVVYSPPEGIEIKVEKQTTVIVSGVDKQSVGQVAANIRGFRKPEPYHGKGVRYTDERIITKVGKAGGK